MLGLVAQGFLLGVATGASCLPQCAPAMVPLVIAQGPGRRWLPLGQLLAGRLLAYLLLGLAAAWCGRELLTGVVARRLAGVATVGLAVLLIWQGGRAGLTEQGCFCAGQRRWLGGSAWAVGFGLGLAPCVPLLQALVQAGVAGPAGGLVLLTAFFGGTTLWLWPLAWLGALGRRRYWRQMATTAMVLAGLWYLVRGGVLMLC